MSGELEEDGICSRCGDSYENRNEGGDPPYLCDPCAQAVVVELRAEHRQAPREPTQEMTQLGKESYQTPNTKDQSIEGMIRRVWRVMWDAAP